MLEGGDKTLRPILRIETAITCSL